MTRLRWRSRHQAGTRSRGVARAVATAALLAVAAMPLAGCVAGESSPDVARLAGRVERVGYTPRVGDCWQEPDYEVVSSWSWWQGSGSVDCDAEHNSITAAVGEIPDDFPAPSEAGETPELDAEDYAVVREICTDWTDDDVGLEEGTRIDWFWYLPSPRQWAAGERWLRCDVAVAALGPLSPRAVEPLPAEVEDVMSRLWDEYSLCLDTPYPAEGHRPWDDPVTSVAVSCDGDHQWRHVMSMDNPDDELPPQAELIERAGPQCQEMIELNQAAGGILYVPSEETWAEGVRTSKCWIHY